jgi:hypothetical protein
MKNFILPFIALLFCNQLLAQISVPEVPKVHTNIQYNDKDEAFVIWGDDTLTDTESALYYLHDYTRIYADSTGLIFDSRSDDTLNGTLYFGLIHYKDSKHPLPVFYGSPLPIENGKAKVDIKNRLSGKYDMTGWTKSGFGTLGYRVVDEAGKMLYEGRQNFQYHKDKKKFETRATIIEGPFVNRVTPTSVTISATTNSPAIVKIEVEGKEYQSKAEYNHEILIDGLKPDKAYNYTAKIWENEQNYAFRTAPLPGVRKPFTFAYASDSRGGSGGGERDLYGANYYVIKKIMALSMMRDIEFAQFSGDLIDGYVTSGDDIDLQYVNWKRSVEAFAHYFPIYTSMGNHECLMRLFTNQKARKGVAINNFGFEDASSEAYFAKHFVNPQNGPKSEDGSVLDPDPKTTDFPSYDENVFYYTHDNVAVIVLNSNYLYSPTNRSIPIVGGGLHGYIMDNQLQWLEETVNTLEADKNIDHVFVTLHTPFFPNGGHLYDDMWYNGNNEYRPYIAGKAAEKGILERRDQLLDILVNKSKKTIAILTGDEHNYAKTEVGPKTNIYPEDYKESKIKLKRTIYQVNNGAAGAPYYSQEQTPWTPFVSGFTTQHAVVFFNVNGKSLELEVVNPDTLEEIERKKLR